MIAPGMPGYIEGGNPKRDLEGAKALMKEAGSSGFDAEVEVIAETDRLTACQIMQANLADIGINLIINSSDRGTYWGLADQKR